MSIAGEVLEERTGHRRTIVRMAILYTPVAVAGSVLAGISLLSLFQGNLGALLPAIVLGLIAVALILQAVSALRDLRAEPAITTGEVRRVWTKGTVLWFFRSHYLHVGRGVFDVSPVTHYQIIEGDFLEIEHWPHTKSVVAVRRLRRDDNAPRTQNVPSRMLPQQEPFELPDPADVAMRGQNGWLDGLWRRRRR